MFYIFKLALPIMNYITFFKSFKRQLSEIYLQEIIIITTQSEYIMIKHILCHYLLVHYRSTN